MRTRNTEIDKTLTRRVFQSLWEKRETGNENKAKTTFPHIFIIIWDYKLITEKSRSRRLKTIVSSKARSRRQWRRDPRATPAPGNSTSSSPTSQCPHRSSTPFPPRPSNPYFFRRRNPRDQVIGSHRLSRTLGSCFYSCFFSRWLGLSGLGLNLTRCFPFLQSPAVGWSEVVGFRRLRLLEWWGIGRRWLGMGFGLSRMGWHLNLAYRLARSIRGGVRMWRWRGGSISWWLSLAGWISSGTRSSTPSW